METQQTYRVGDYYLTKNRAGNWCRSWYDEKTQQRKSVSLRTRDFIEAKQLIDQWFILNAQPVLDNNLTLAQCIALYYENHAKHLTRHDAERRNLMLWLDFFEVSMVREIKAPRQREFIQFLHSKKYAKSTIEGIFKTGCAAIRYACSEDMISSAPNFIDLGKEMRKFKALKKPKSRPLELLEIAQLLEQAGTDRLVRYIMILLGTGARPAAALELEGSQIDLHAGTIQLLKEGNEQSNKYRATVRLPTFIRAIYHTENICSRGYIQLNPNKPVDSIKSSWNTARKNAKLDDLVNPGSFRKTVAKWLRTCGVEPWHVSAQLGHRRQGSEITEIYAPNDPAYLATALEAIEGYFAILYKISPRLQRLEQLRTYEARCDLVAKYENNIR